MVSTEGAKTVREHVAAREAGGGEAGAAAAMKSKLDADAKFQDCSTAFFALTAAAQQAQRGCEGGEDRKDNPTNVITQEIFRVGAGHLGLDYFQEAEVHRIWKRFHGGRKLPCTSEMMHEAFCEACMQNETLFAIVIQINACVAAKRFKPPESYDYEESTGTNYRLASLDSFGPYSDEREGGEPPAKRDYTYHNNYIRERQEWQDHIVRLATTRHYPQPRPWIVFTCGGMGCGKGYTFQQLSRSGHFPIEDIVRIDPDSFKTLMPEWRGYASRGLDAGSLTHLESAYIQEVCQEAALRRQQNIWVDGSLRDGRWFAKVFDDIRLRHPIYRIGIIHVHASEDVTRRRITERAARTGRSVPEALIKASMAAPRDSLFELETRCDWVARIDNEVSPRLVAFQQIDRTSHWGAMSSRWVSVEPAPYEFPNKLAPMAMKTVPDVRLSEPDRLQSKGGLVDVMYSSASSASDSCTSKFVMSPMSVILVANSATGYIFRDYFGICADSLWISFFTPTSLHDLFPLGGFFFFDQARRLVRTVAIAGQCSTCRFKHFVEFHNPVSKRESDLGELLEEQHAERWSTSMPPELHNGGALRFMWVCPGEIPEAGGVGAFLYELKDEKFSLFPVRAPS